MSRNLTETTGVSSILPWRRRLSLSVCTFNAKVLLQESICLFGRRGVSVKSPC